MTAVRAPMTPCPVLAGSHVTDRGEPGKGKPARNVIARGEVAGDATGSPGGSARSADRVRRGRSHPAVRTSVRRAG